MITRPGIDCANWTTTPTPAGEIDEVGLACGSDTTESGSGESTRKGGPPSCGGSHARTDTRGHIPRQFLFVIGWGIDRGAGPSGSTKRMLYD